MDPNAQSQMAHPYAAYYSSGDEGGLTDEYSARVPGPYAHAGPVQVQQQQQQPQQQQQQQHHNQYGIPNTSKSLCQLANEPFGCRLVATSPLLYSRPHFSLVGPLLTPSVDLDMNQLRPDQLQQIQMQHQHSHQAYAMQPHPSMQPQVQPVQVPVTYDPSRATTAIYQHPSVTSPPPPPSPYDPVSPAHSVSDHSGTESIGPTPIRTGGVPIMPASRVYHHHSHSSASSTSSLHGEHPYATPAMPYGNPNAASMRHHSRTRSVETTPPPGQYHGSDEDEIYGNSAAHPDPYANQISLLNRKESTRRQRIQAEQRRRDELRDGYARLKDVLPITNAKSSKVSLIERARNHILDIDGQNQALRNEVEALRKEVARLQEIAEKMAMNMSIPIGNLKSESGTNSTQPNPTASTAAAVPSVQENASEKAEVPDAAVNGKQSGGAESDEDLYAQMLGESPHRHQDASMSPREKTPQ